jgi:hypothetical protein
MIETWGLDRHYATPRTGHGELETVPAVPLFLDELNSAVLVRHRLAPLLGQAP